MLPDRNAMFAVWPNDALRLSAGGRYLLGLRPEPRTRPRGTLIFIMVVAMSVSRKERVAKTDIKALEGIVKAGKFERQMDKPMLFTFTGDLLADAVRLRVVVRDDKTGNIGTSDLSAGE